MYYLYELVNARQQPFSPYCWRVRHVLTHLGLRFKTHPLGFTEVATLRPALSRTVPILEHQGQWLADSWEISCALHEANTDKSLFPDTQSLADSKSLVGWINTTLAPIIVKYIVLDIYQRLRERDQPYFRESREKRFGASLEQIQLEARRDPNRFSRALGPIEERLGQHPFLSGEKPGYADYALLSLWDWIEPMSDYNILPADHPVINWRDRCRARLYPDS